MLLATDEDLARDFPDGFVFGIPVRPPKDEREDDDVDDESDED